MRKIAKTLVALTMMFAMVASFAFAASERFIDVQEYNATDIQPRWTYINHIDNGLLIDNYVVEVSANTVGYTYTKKATVTAVLQQKKANGEFVDYKSFSDEGSMGAVVSESLTVPYGTYRVVSYHSAGDGDTMEYKSLVGPAKRVPFGDLDKG